MSARRRIRRRSSRRGAIVLAVSVASVIGSGGMACAYFTTLGSGSGSAKARNGYATFTTAATATSATVLYPGITGAPISFVVNNSANTYAMTVTSLAVDPGRPIAVDAAHAACTAPAITVAPAALSLSVAAGANSAPQIANVLSMGAAAQNACQGAAFTIPLILTGRSPS